VFKSRPRDRLSRLMFFLVLLSPSSRVVSYIRPLPFPSKSFQIYHLLIHSFRSRGSSVSIVSDYGLDDQAIGVRSPAEAKGFFL
jgi:hypothetical protein